MGRTLHNLHGYARAVLWAAPSLVMISVVTRVAGSRYARTVTLGCRVMTPRHPCPQVHFHVLPPNLRGPKRSQALAGLRKARRLTAAHSQYAGYRSIEMGSPKERCASPEVIDRQQNVASGALADDAIYHWRRGKNERRARTRVPPPVLPTRLKGFSSIACRQFAVAVKWKSTARQQQLLCQGPYHSA